LDQEGAALLAIVILPAGDAIIKRILRVSMESPGGYNLA